MSGIVHNIRPVISRRATSNVKFDPVSDAKSTPASSASVSLPLPSIVRLDESFWDAYRRLSEFAGDADILASIHKDDLVSSEDARNAVLPRNSIVIDGLPCLL